MLRRSSISSSIYKRVPIIFGNNSSSNRSPTKINSILHFSRTPSSMVKIKVFSDYVCPYCFLAEFPLNEALKERKKKNPNEKIEVEWMPFELRPKPTPTLRPEGEYLQQAWKYGVYPMAQRMNVPIRLPRISPQPWTDLAFEGYQYAKQRGKGSEYNHRMFTAFFQEERDISNVDELVNLMREVIGQQEFDEKQFRDELMSHTNAKKHQEALAEARKNKITSVPTFIFEYEDPKKEPVRIEGMMSKEDIDEMIQMEYE